MWRRMSVALVLMAFISLLSNSGMSTENDREGWRLAVQAWSFNRQGEALHGIKPASGGTFYEAVDKTRALGLKYIEAYPGQRLSEDKPDVRFDHNMSSDLRQEVLQKLREAGVKLINYGVVRLVNDKVECRQVFNFARDMGIETIVSEPPEDAFDLIDKLCEEYQINVAIHNHPRPSHYWNPDTVLKVCEGRSERIGACADTGHWMRSGINPIEAIKKLEGRIISLHFKDLNEFGEPAAHDVIWGTGKADVSAILAELNRQGFEGVFSIEYEYNWLNSMPEIAGCVSFFERTESELGRNDWQWIFNGKDLTGWDGDPRLWKVVDGAIRGQTTEENPAQHNTFCIWRAGRATRPKAWTGLNPASRGCTGSNPPSAGLKDFELKIKFRIQNGNSGIQYRSKEFDKWRITGYQAEVEDTPGKVGYLYHEAGRGRLVYVGDFDVIDNKGNKNIIGRVADREELIKAGYYREKDWNEYHIIACGNHLKHYLNGYQTMELVDNDRVTNPDDPQDRKGSAREGLLALQIHTGPPMIVEFKDIRIRHLKPSFSDATIIFNGKDFNDWEVKGDKKKSKWVVGTAKMSSEDPKLLVNTGGNGEMVNLVTKHGDQPEGLDRIKAAFGGLDIYSKAKFGDCRIELEVMVPKGSNSGIYVMGEYEVQVLDSWDSVKMGSGDMGAIYGAAPPPVNACKRPGQWQKYVIEFLAPRFDADGNKKDNAKFLRVELNGQILHKDLEMPGPTRGGLTGKEAPTGPIMFQGNHGPVAYRNIIVKPLVK